MKKDSRLISTLCLDSLIKHYTSCMELKVINLISRLQLTIKTMADKKPKEVIK